MKKRIVFTGGGTAGHIMPNLALYSSLKKDFDCYYIGSKNGMEKTMIPSLMPYYEIETTKLRRSISPSNLLIPFKLIKGICNAKKILKQIKPDIVFSKGGFVSVPVVIAASKLNIPVITHESDYTLGLANKIISKKCKYVCTSFDLTAKNIKNGIYTGSIIRPEVLDGNKQKILKQFNFNTQKKNILVIGGSLGSEKINSSIHQNVNDLLKNYNILHIVGKGKINTNINKKGYEQVEFLKNVGDAFDFADMVITRGGSNALFELLALSKPMLIIPLSKQESRGDQILNANYFYDKGFANVLMEENLNSKTLKQSIEQTFNNASNYKKNMQSQKINGTKKVMELIKQIAK